MQLPEPMIETARPRDPREVLESAFPGLDLRRLRPGEIPQPYRSLLVHDQDMTSTLERFHGEPSSLETLSVVTSGGILRRTVLLVGDVTGLPRELGSILIHLHRFSREAREQIVACRRPLGAILGDHEIPYLSHPQGFLALQSSPEILTALRLGSGPAILYGRRNSLRDPDGELLADVLEILPPVTQQGK